MGNINVQMLNINDIHEKNALKNIPKEIEETRNLITDSFKNLKFVEDCHKYFIVNDNNEVELPSVSSIITQWVPEVDWDEKAELKAAKLGITAEELKKQWHEKNIISTHCGSKTHFFGEQAMNMIIGNEDLTKNSMPFQYTDDGYLIPYCPKEWAITRYYNDILNNKDVFPVMPEAKIYTNYNSVYVLKQPYAGTFDILLGYRYKGDIVYSIQDFKGLPIDTPILTTNGFKCMGDLQVGEFVYDKDGKPTKIMNCSQIHYKPCMKICFDDGYSITADEEHRWLISFNNHKKCEEQIMTTKEIYNYINELRKKKRKYAHLIPKIYISDSLKNERLLKLPIDPYVLGVWLGDGHSACAYITNKYDAIFDEIENRGYKVGVNVDKTRHCGQAKTRCVFGLQTLLRENSLLKNKHIPEKYIVNSTIEQRIDLLRGFMDADGYYNKTRNRYVMSTTRIEQANEFVKLLTSIGIKPTLLKAQGKCSNCPNKKTFKRWDVCFTTNIYPFLVRKIETKNVKYNKHKWRNIMCVEKVETVPTRCIEVNSDTHTYLADKMLLVTHNTNADLYKDYSHTYNVMMKPPFDEMGFYEEPYFHYVIQLNCYQIGLMQLGLKIVDRTIVWLKEDGTYEKVEVPDITDILLEIL